MREHLPPRAFWSPINGAEMLALDRPGFPFLVAQQALRAFGQVSARVQVRLAPQKRAGDDIRRLSMQHELSAFSRALLLDERSISRTLFRRRDLERLLTPPQTAGVFEALSLLVTVELWRALVEDMSSRQRQIQGTGG